MYNSVNPYKTETGPGEIREIITSKWKSDSFF